MSHLRESFEAVAKERGADGLSALRERAFLRFEELGFPTTKDEEWLYTNVAPIAKSDLALGRPSTNGVASDDVERLGIGGDCSARLVFVDGHFREDLSRTGAVEVRSLAQALTDDRDAVLAHLGRHAGFEQQAFVALNTAMMEDGAFLQLPAHTVLEAPIHLLHLSTGGKASHPRHLFVAGESAEATIVETHASLGEEAQWTNAVVEAVVAPNASLDYYKLQLENERALHLSSLHVQQAADSRFRSHAVTLGGGLTRNDIDASLDGENITTTLNGLFLTRDAQHVDNHTRLHHRQPHCDSHELYKGILDDRSTGAFCGKIHVYEDAQKTDAKQSSKNLLLSDEAVVDAKPQLEIYADDVKCTHGATIGQLDDQALFYLRARGIAKADALNLLVHAFASDITSRVRVAEVRDRIEEMLTARLPGGSEED